MMTPEDYSRLLESATDEELAEFEQLTAPKPIPYCPHVPWPKQQAFLDLTDVREVFYGGAAGGGKATRLDEPIPTPVGWKTMGDLEVGDTIFSDLGEPCQVTAAYPVIENPVSYRLEFDDGSTIETCENHQWITYDAYELAALTRRDPEWRARRRANRPSRATGNKSVAFMAAISARNSVATAQTLPIPTGSVRMTREISETLRTNSGRSNHAVPVAKPLWLPCEELLIDPYVLGAWLGDGSKHGGGFAGIDPEIWEEIEKSGYEITHSEKNKYAHYISKLVGDLKLLGVHMNKHVPIVYLRGSINQRLALLQGLMDTDGTVCDSGKGRSNGVEFTNTNKRIIDGVYELIVSLGWKARVIEGRATLNGRDCGAKWEIKWTPDNHVFRLPRKRDSQTIATRRTTKFRYIVRCERVDSTPMRCIAVDSPSHLFLAGKSMIPTHNSDALLYAALQYVDHPKYSAIIFRRTVPELTMAGGLIDRANEWFGGTDARWHGTTKTWTFPSGATLRLSSMQLESDKYNFKGGEFQFVGFDELTSFTESQYRYLFSRTRRLEGSEIPIRMRSASNPGDIGHDWVKKRFVKQVVNNPERRFVPARLEDNPSLDYDDYVASLAELDPITRKQLLAGDWDAYEGGRFQKTWFRHTFRQNDLSYFLKLPNGKEEEVAKILCSRFTICDPAATEEDSSDPTAIAAFAMTPDKKVLVLEVVRAWIPLEDIAPTIRDVANRNGSQYVGIEATAFQWAMVHLGRKTQGMPPVKPLSASIAGQAKITMQKGKSGKLVRATPAIVKASNGEIFLPSYGAWIEDFVGELILFTGDDKKDAHDDQVDVLAYGCQQVDFAPAVQQKPAPKPAMDEPDRQAYPRERLIPHRNSAQARRGIFGMR